MALAIAVSQGFTAGAAEAGACRASLALYGAAIAALNGAIAAIAADDIRARCSAVRAATEAVTTLYLNLDVKRSGELVDDLADLYGYILGRLLRVNLYNDPRIAEQVIDLLEPLREGAAGNGRRDALAALPATAGASLAPQGAHRSE